MDSRLDQPGDRPPEHDRRASRGVQDSPGAARRSATSTKPFSSWQTSSTASPDNRHAHFCRASSSSSRGSWREAHKHFQRVTELDPHDATSWYWTASTLTDPETRPSPPDRGWPRSRSPSTRRHSSIDPYLTQAIYKLSFASRLAGQPDKQKELLDRWNKINPDRQQPVPGPGNSAAKVYGEMGKYATVIIPSRGPRPPRHPRRFPRGSSRPDRCR